MTLFIIALSVIAFVAAFQATGLVPKAREAMAISRRTAAVMGDRTLDDDAKERLVQKAAADLMKGFAGLLVRILAVLVAAYVPILAADLAGLVPQARSFEVMLRLDVIAASTIIVIAVLWLLQRRRGV